MTPSRRSFLRAGSAAIVGLSVQGSRRLLASGKPRIGIVGGGLAGVCCAWLLDGVAESVVFEARPVLGGHADTVAVPVPGGEIVQADLGAQFFGPATHPTYVKLLQLVGLIDDSHPDEDATIDIDMTISITEAGRPQPRFVSPARGRTWPLFAPWNQAALRAFLVFTIHARQLVQNGDWLVSLGDWLGGLPVPAEQRDHLLLPMLAALTGCSLEQAPALSARGAVFFVAGALPSLRFSNSLIGVGGNVERIAAQASDLTARLGSPVVSVSPRPGGGYRIASADGAASEVDAVVFACPPYLAGPLLGEIPALGDAAPLLGQLPHFTAVLSIHRDPAYMPAKRAWWSSYNADLADGYCEGSVWYGALRPPVPGHGAVSLFKSWVTARSREPQLEVARRSFRHPLVTPAFIETQRSLAAFQGLDAVWFAGSYLKEVDSQETALRSAMDAVRAIAPEAPNLLALGG